MNYHYDQFFMQRAIDLAKFGRGDVEPNPMVGCLIVRPDLHDASGMVDIVQDPLPQVVGKGYHQKYGEAHAEVNALREAGELARGGTLYVTLEPCCHTGKTPPCCKAILEAGIKRVVVGMTDPNPVVHGNGLEILRQEGIEVEIGVLAEQVATLYAPYITRLTKKRPWIIGKWAMTLDGKMATKTGSSYWISNEKSRQRLHYLRSYMDAIMIGSRTAMEDDPKLTVRLPEGETPHRTPVRIVFDSGGTLSVFSELALSARDVPLLLIFGPNTPPEKVRFWEGKGAEVLVLEYPTHEQRLITLMETLAERGMTNVLIEGGGKLLGHLFDLEYLDEVHVFVAPKIVGGDKAVVPVGGIGRELMKSATDLINREVETIGTDILISGRLDYTKRK
ncbi:MAG: bifunctional diaminohydroxyphosphoribosylaminopyrimidine deaminase/5-amino-6-(5-phosphoribosylamino)uracil reductase RibD [Planctomycetia bacterium]|nr:bifunctional diaminohydroxyphosphoribosylaminopyrimidine deaminase/5-amino-6-(5-phosphoribosylamino)uracil reductase RibD [Planctomycetia bacterium]